MTKENANMADITKADVLEWVKSAPALELAELVEEMEEVFGVSAAAPVAVAAAPGAAGGEAAAEEEKDSFDVVLTGAGDKKIQVIKAVRALTSLGLKEAKEVVEGAPSNVLEGVSKEEADKAKEQIEEAGGTVELK
jgi:large subunit ribosomal protein L7/L12